MHAPIALIAPDKSLYHLAVRLQETLPFPFYAHQAYLDQAVQVAQELVENGTRVLVSRGGTLEALRQNIEMVPIVEIPISDSDVLSLLLAAKDISDRIAFIGFSRPWLKAADKLAQVLNLNIKSHVVNSEEEALAKVAHVVEHNQAGVIVGAKMAYEAAIGMGVPAILLDSSEPAVRTALLNAANTLHAIDQERLHSQLQTTILNNIDAGLMVLSTNGTVIQYNQPAENIFSLNQGTEKLSEALTHLLGGTPLANARISDKLIRMGSRKLLCTIQPVLLDGETQQVLLRVDSLNRVQEMEQKSRYQLAEHRLQARHVFDDVLCRSPVMLRVKEQAEKYASTDLTIMIRGESGTGKELLAQSIHNASQRRKGPFVAINCGALADSILESELFGYVEGAFTGARRGGKMGVFELAHTGTLFLDEIGEMSLSMQSRLLRVLEENEIIRLGDVIVRPVDVRVICATNKNLEQMILEGTFRRDLYYRIEILEITVPPLAQRVADIQLLLEHFFQSNCASMDRAMPRLSPEAHQRLLQYPWPGNVRELRNIASRLFVEFSGQRVSDADICSMLNIPLEQDARERLHSSERELIFRTIESCNGDKAQAARLLGISSSTLWRKLKKYSD